MENNNWCIKVYNDNRNIVIGYLNRKFNVNMTGERKYYGVVNGVNFGIDSLITAEITTEQFIEMVKKEGYKVEQNNLTHQWRFTHKPNDNILGTSTNNPPINKFFSELDKDTKEFGFVDGSNKNVGLLDLNITPKQIQSDGGSTQYYQIEITNSNGEKFNCELNDILRDVFNNQWDLCNIVKASRRISEARKGQGKKDVSVKYDANKIIWFAEEIKNLNK